MLRQVAMVLALVAIVMSQAPKDSRHSSHESPKSSEGHLEDWHKSGDSSLEELHRSGESHDDSHSRGRDSSSEEEGEEGMRPHHGGHDRPHSGSHDSHHRPGHRPRPRPGPGPRPRPSGRPHPRPRPSGRPHPRPRPTGRPERPEAIKGQQKGEKKNVINGQIRLEADFQKIENKKFAFETAVTRQLSLASNLPREAFSIDKLYEGSIIVVYTITETEDMDEDQLNVGVGQLKLKLASESTVLEFEGQKMSVMSSNIWKEEDNDDDMIECIGEEGHKWWHHKWKKYSYIAGGIGVLICAVSTVLCCVVCVKMNKRRALQRKKQWAKQELANSFENEIYGKLPEKVKFDEQAGKLPEKVKFDDMASIQTSESA